MNSRIKGFKVFSQLLTEADTPEHSDHSVVYKRKLSGKNHAHPAVS
jgi:hypothetical protein